MTETITPPAAVQMTVGVAGLGLLGRGIVACLLANGFKVVGQTRSASTLAEARTYVGDAIDDLVRHKAAPPVLAAEWPSRYVEVGTAREMGACDFVIESVFEDLDVKRQIFDDLESTLASSVPIASNTSALPISTLQTGRRVPGRFIGMHWAEPCHLTRFLEVIRGEQTDDATVEATLRLARRAGKDPTLVNLDVEGFIVNRLGYAMYREAIHLLESGVASVAEIDRAYRNAAGLWAAVAGPFRWMDLTGIQSYAKVMERLFPKLATTQGVPETIRKLVESGAQGVTNGRGFYTYTPEERHDWERRLREHVWVIRDVHRREFPIEVDPTNDVADVGGRA